MDTNTLKALRVVCDHSASSLICEMEKKAQLPKLYGLTAEQIEDLHHSMCQSFFIEQSDRFECYGTSLHGFLLGSKKQKIREDIIKNANLDGDGEEVLIQLMETNVNFKNNKSVMLWFKSKMEAYIAFNYYCEKKLNTFLLWDLAYLWDDEREENGEWCICVQCPEKFKEFSH